MLLKCVVISLVTQVFFVNFCNGQYQVPPAKLEAIWPKGLRVSIPGKGKLN